MTKMRHTRRRVALRWVRRNRPALSVKLPAWVEKHILQPMIDRDDDLTHGIGW